MTAKQLKNLTNKGIDKVIETSTTKTLDFEEKTEDLELLSEEKLLTKPKNYL
ncbi:hypothetical protein SCLARK_00575 [Spiroplasma clarkii]|uniref:hypothetical protein n=1 Tax=Spiroplasma clarkii TaxID=2139 RepID=UPI000B5785FB|nr:hypothetical protein [Spiroplasma clarkii]ARU91252.1 hypothetical protein SCLARK_00575 [Spiroplasma clarkii]